jgi:hypothetical protein
LQPRTTGRPLPSTPRQTSSPAMRVNWWC